MFTANVENNAETGRRRGAGLIDESLKENKISASIIDAANALLLDLLVNDCVIVEVKATESILKIHSAQLLTYLRLSQHKLGLVLNFGQPLLIDEITRVVNNF